MLVSYEHLFLEIFLRTCLYYAKLCTHFKSHSHKRARTLQRGLVFRQFKLFCLQTASSIDFGQIVEPVNCMIRPTLIVIYLGFKEAWTVKVLHFYEASIWMLLLDYYLLCHKCFFIRMSIDVVYKQPPLSTLICLLIFGHCQTSPSLLISVNFAPHWMLLLDCYLLSDKCFCIKVIWFQKDLLKFSFAPKMNENIFVFLP